VSSYDLASNIRQAVALGTIYDSGDGVAAPDYPAAAGWYK
jgi:hypothetical protein